MTTGRNDEIPPHSLREFIAVLLAPIQVELREVRAAIQELAGGIIAQERIETLKYQVASQSEMLQENEHRLRILERFMLIQFVLNWTILIVLLSFLVIRYILP